MHQRVQAHQDWVVFLTIFCLPCSSTTSAFRKECQRRWHLQQAYIIYPSFLPRNCSSLIDLYSRRHKKSIRKRNKKRRGWMNTSIIKEWHKTFEYNSLSFIFYWLLFTWIHREFSSFSCFSCTFFSFPFLLLSQTREILSYAYFVAYKITCQVERIVILQGLTVVKDPLLNNFVTTLLFFLTSSSTVVIPFAWLT